MKQVQDYPPIIDEIDAVFHVKDTPGILYAWGDTIFNPSGVYVAKELIMHELIHSARQGGRPEEWWKRYLVDPEFRFAEELPAHVAEYIEFCGGTKIPQRRQKRLDLVAERLSSKLYGNMLSFEKARRLIVKKVKEVT